MKKMCCEELLIASGGKLVSGLQNTHFINISTDTRTLKGGELFVPLVGENFDGHDFIQDAFRLGASGVLTERQIEAVDNKVIIKVDDTLAALGDIAAYYRKKFNIHFVAVTGSVGKTSTKDMVAKVLSQGYKVLKTEENFNNEIGLPLTIFNLESFHQAAVIEMGMSGFGEIRRLTSIVKPDIAIITNIGLSHIEKLGSRQNILKAKLEILEGLNRNGLVILNIDDTLLSGMKDLLKFRTVFCGLQEDADYYAYNINLRGEKGTNFEIKLNNREYKVDVPIPGIHYVYNALAAIAVGIELNIPIDKIIEGISEFIPSKMRLDIISKNNIKVINDTYNASPQSMEAAISVLNEIGKGKRTIAVLGDMMEMGEWAVKEHISVGYYVEENRINHLVTVGNNARDIARGALSAGMPEENIHSFDNNEEAIVFLKKFLYNDDIVLVKGSRGMKMEQIVNEITKECKTI